MLAVLQSLLASGTAICPLSDSAMFELHKQTDPETRVAMARVMDALSLGATIQNGMDRMRTELVWFFYPIIVEQRIPVPPIEHVWLKAGHFLGSATPVFEHVDPAENLAISKAFFDLLWSVSVEEMLTDSDWAEDDTVFRWAAKRMTESSRQHAAEVTSFEQLYLAEVAGIVDASAKMIDDAFIEIAAAQGVASSVQLDADISHLHRNAVYNLIQLGKAGTGLPQIQIEAGIHAAVRWLAHRALQANDFYDIYHPTAALPYCDIFLTEAFVGTILKNPPLAFGKVFRTEYRLLLEQAIVRDHRLDTTGPQSRAATMARCSSVQAILHVRVSVGQTSAAEQRCRVVNSAAELAIRDATLSRRSVSPSQLSCREGRAFFQVATACARRGDGMCIFQSGGPVAHDAWHLRSGRMHSAHSLERSVIECARETKGQVTPETNELR